MSTDHWPGGHPPRWYAAQILRLREARRAEALSRVPAEVRDMVVDHLATAERTKAMNQGSEVA